MLLLLLSRLSPSLPTSLGTLASTKASPLLQFSERLPRTRTFPTGLELWRAACIWCDTAFGIIPAPRGQPEPSLCYQHQEHVPHFLNIVSEQRSGMRRGCLCICVAEDTHGSRLEAPSKAICLPSPTGDAPRCSLPVAVATARCARLRSELQSHLLAARITVLASDKHGKSI